MDRRKCPNCKECLDLALSPTGSRFYICWLCGKYFQLQAGGVIKELPLEEFEELVKG